MMEFSLLGFILLIWRTSADVPKAEDLHWTSLDFSTVLTWRTSPSQHTYTVLYSEVGSDWLESPDCIEVSEGECDLTMQLQPLDRVYTADVKTEPAADEEHLVDIDELPHTYSPPFNPYEESNLSAPSFSLRVLDRLQVSVNVSDPLTAIHNQNRQLTIRDVLQNQLLYRVSYSRAGSTGKKELLSNSSSLVVSGLDSGESYCFIVAAFVPTRARTNQLGLWSHQRCIAIPGPETGLTVGGLVGVIFIVLTVIIVFIVIFVLCCRKKNKRQPANQTTSDPV